MSPDAGMGNGPRLGLSGERFSLVYHLSGPRAKAEETAADIAIEQTIEFPPDLVSDEEIRERIIGRVESLRELAENRFEAAISFAIEIAGVEITQLLNVAFGNISLKSSIRLVRFDLPESVLRFFRGPRFGRNGLRSLISVPTRPLLGTALKPLGLSPPEIAELAYKFALDGIDLIKDDHGLADQPFCRFDERVARAAEAVHRANEKTGRQSLYLPNVTAPLSEIRRRVRFAVDAGAGGLLIAPGLVGFDAMREIADDDSVALPILSHPAFHGSFVTHPAQGLSHFALFGQIPRLCGADACIFPHHGGRFPISRDECKDLAAGTGAPMAHLRPIFPMPAGGMRKERVPEIVDFYGPEVVLLIGGDLYRKRQG